jgi:hypothetical protein
MIASTFTQAEVIFDIFILVCLVLWLIYSYYRMKAIYFCLVSILTKISYLTGLLEARPCVVEGNKHYEEERK